jgi:hypothetical protein
MSNRLTTWLLSLTLFLMVGVYWQMGLLRATVKKLGDVVFLQRPAKEGEVSATISWTSGGTPHTHTATRNSGESTADFRARFADEVDKQFVLYPPD